MTYPYVPLILEVGRRRSQTTKVAAGACIVSTNREMDMTQRRSNTYEELEHTLDEFPPNEPVTTHMVINGQVIAGGRPSMTASEVQRELADLVQGAEAFEVFVTVMHDEIENTAFVALSGKARRLGDLAAFMSTARAASAR